MSAAAVCPQMPLLKRSVVTPLAGAGSHGCWSGWLGWMEDGRRTCELDFSFRFRIINVFFQSTSEEICALCGGGDVMQCQPLHFDADCGTWQFGT